MRLSRLYLEGALRSGSQVQLSASAAGHVTRVLRLRAGAPVTLFNGSGSEFAGRIEAVQGSKVTVQVGEERAIRRESPLLLTLAQGVSRGERMDLVVQKATELGATHLVPVLTERSIVKLAGEQAQRKLAHWRAIAIAACEQSGRNGPPQVSPPVGFAQFLAGTAAQATRLILTPSSHRRGTGARGGGRVHRRAHGAARAAHRDRSARGPDAAAARVRGFLRWARASRGAAAR
jgi:16S rRNA (uracil1498-N3)-methyltransferase